MWWKRADSQRETAFLRRVLSLRVGRYLGFLIVAVLGFVFAQGRFSDLYQQVRGTGISRWSSAR